MLLNKQWITEKIKEQIKKYLETNENRNTMIQYPGDAAKAILRVKFIKRDRCLLQYSRKVPNKQYKLMLNGTRKI